MPIYEYECECGAVLESIERISEKRTACGELCTKDGAPGDGRVERRMCGSLLRGTGHEAKAPTIDVHKRAGRRFDDCA